MWIQSIELNNFKKHSKLVLEFTDKLNVIYGESDTGKSCIIRAIKWVFFNEGKDVRKENTKKTSVKVTLDNDVVVEKIKSNTVNAYVLYKDGEEKRFDAIGKIIPEEIQKALKVSTVDIDKKSIILNIADQITLPFLVGETATLRAKLFNKLTGNDITDKVFTSLNKDILKIGRETKLETEHLKEQELKLQEIQLEKNKIEKLHKEFSDKYKIVKELSKKYENLNEYLKKSNEINEDLKETEDKLKTLKYIPEDLLKGLDESVNKLEKFNVLIKKIKEVKEELENTEKEIKSLLFPKVDINVLKEKHDRLEKLKNKFSQLLEIEGDAEMSDYKIDKYKDLIKEGNKKYKEILKQIKVCPFYKKVCPLNKEII